MQQENESRWQKNSVAWDFSRKPSGTLHRVLLDEFGPNTQEDKLTQRNLAIFRDGFIASRLAALADQFGAKIAYFAIYRLAFFFAGCS